MPKIHCSEFPPLSLPFELKLCGLYNLRLDEPLQSAYKHSHSTQTGLLKVFNDILTKMDDKELAFLTDVMFFGCVCFVCLSVFVNTLLLLVCTFW